VVFFDARVLLRCVTSAYILLKAVIRSCSFWDSGAAPGIVTATSGIVTQLLG